MIIDSANVGNLVQLHIERFHGNYRLSIRNGALELAGIDVKAEELYRAVVADTPAKLLTWVDGVDTKAEHWVTPIGGNHVLNDVAIAGVDVNLSTNPDMPGVVQIIVEEAGETARAFISLPALVDAALALSGKEGVGTSTPPEVEELQHQLAAVRALIDDWSDTDALMTRSDGVRELTAALNPFQFPTNHAAVIEGTYDEGKGTRLTKVGNRWLTDMGVSLSEADILSKFTHLEVIHHGVEG